jgi:Fe-S-cluster containining protein
MVFSEERRSRLSELERRLEVARRCPAEKLAARIREIGFECILCGKCCDGEDNSVVVFPFEIRRIMDKTGDAWLDVAIPPTEGEWDSQGNFHTLEWRIKKEGNSCKFYDGGCRIYESQPALCRTYPFYLDEGVLRVSECPGLGREICVKESEELARDIIERCVTEIKESIALLERYEEFERSGFSDDGPSKEGACIVHDSEGRHSIAFDRLPGFRQRVGYAG